MSLNRGFEVAIVVVYAALATTCLAGDPAKIIDSGKKATALVDIQSREFGSAFCIDPSGLFVTNAHVVKRAIQGNRVLLVVQPGELAQKLVQAKVVRTDEGDDLALLLADSADRKMDALELGSTSGLFETASVTAFGYPFGRLLVEKGATGYPNVTVSTGHVTSLRKVGGALQHIQLDASLNPGNSGGPVLDENGRVVGVVQAGIFGSGVNLAIPVDKLSKFLDTPQIIFDPPPVPFASRHDPRDFLIKVVSLGRNKPARLAVQLTVRNGSGPERTIIAKLDGDAYHVRIAPLPPPQGQARVQITADYSGGSLSGWMADVPLRCGTRQIKLSEIQSIKNGSQATLTLVDGSDITANLSGLEAADVDFGGLTMHVDLSKAANVRIAPARAEDPATTYKVTVLADSKTVAESSGTLRIDDAAAAALPSHADVPPSPITANLPKEKVEVRLPAPTDDVVVGGGGRYLILPIKKLNKVAIFDVNAARVSHYLPIPPSDVLVAADADKLFIILPEQKIIQRWSLGTFQRELTVALPVDGPVQAVSMGCNSHGPLLLRWIVGGPADTAQYTFLNANTLRPLPDLKVNLAMLNLGRSAHVRASADGSVFGIWATSQMPTGLGLVLLEGSRCESRYLHDSVGFVVPGPDGQYVFTGTAGVYNQQLRHIGGAAAVNSPRISIPAITLGYYLSLSFSQFPAPVAPVSRDTGSLYLIGNDTPLTSLPEMSEIAGNPQEMWPSSDFTLDKRVHFLPTANLLITIPSNTSDELVLRRFDVIDALDKSGIDYLFVSSAPITAARRGGLYRYALEVKSKRGGVTYHLESGPEGMTVSSAGVVTWHAPSDATDTNVILTVRDASGQEIFHTFAITFIERPSGTIESHEQQRHPSAPSPSQ